MVAHSQSFLLLSLPSSTLSACRLILLPNGDLLSIWWVLSLPPLGPVFLWTCAPKWKWKWLPLPNDTCSDSSTDCGCLRMPDHNLGSYLSQFRPGQFHDVYGSSWPWGFSKLHSWPGSWKCVLALVVAMLTDGFPWKNLRHLATMMHVLKVESVLSLVTTSSVVQERSRAVMPVLWVFPQQPNWTEPLCQLVFGCLYLAIVWQRTSSFDCSCEVSRSGALRLATRYVVQIHSRS